MAELQLDNATIMSGSVRLVNDASLCLSPGELVVIIGENGAGKSSLMRALAGYVPLSNGQCRIDGRVLHQLKARDRARLIAWLPQSVPIAWPIHVRDAVALGRFAHGAAPHRLCEPDRLAIDQALSDCELVALAQRSTATLSGGELARVHIARALASQAPILLADEPVAALDPRHQLAIMRLIRASVDAGRSAIVVLHDLGLAARFADRIVGMKQGSIMVDDKPGQVMTPPMIQALFGIDVRIDTHQGWPHPIIS